MKSISLLLVLIQLFIIARWLLSSIKSKEIATIIFLLFYFFYLTLRPIILLFEINETWSYLSNAAYPEPAVLMKAICFHFSFLLLVFLLYQKLCRRNYDSVKFAVIKTGLNNLSVIVFGVGMILAILILILKSDQYIWALLFVILSISHVITRGGAISKILFYIGLGFLSYMLFEYSEDRRDWLAMLMIVFFSYLLKNEFNIFKAVALGSLLLIVIVYISVAFRTDGLTNVTAVTERLSNNVNVVQAALEVETDFSIVYDDYVLLFDHRQFDVGYLYGLTLIKPFYSFIPRGIWEEKPETSSRLFPKYFNNNYYAIGGSQPITFAGEIYWNLSWLSLLLAAPFAYFMRWINSYGVENSDFNGIKISIAIVFFHILRGPLDSFIWFAIFLYAFGYLIISLKHVKTIRRG